MEQCDIHNHHSIITIFASAVYTILLHTVRFIGDGGETTCGDRLNRVGVGWNSLEITKPRSIAILSLRLSRSGVSLQSAFPPYDVLSGRAWRARSRQMEVGVSDMKLGYR